MNAIRNSVIVRHGFLRLSVDACWGVVMSRAVQRGGDDAGWGQPKGDNLRCVSWGPQTVWTTMCVHHVEKRARAQ